MAAYRRSSPPPKRPSRGAGGTVNPVTAAASARNPWPTPNIAGVASDTTAGSAANLSTSHRFFNRADSFIAKIDQNFNPNNMLTGRYYFGDSIQKFPVRTDCGGRPVAGIQHQHSDARAADFSFVREGHQFEPGQRSALGLEPLRGRILPARPELQPQLHRAYTRRRALYRCNGTAVDRLRRPSRVEPDFSQIGATSSFPVIASTRTGIVDNYSWKLGKHDIKFGHEFRRTTILQLIDQILPRQNSLTEVQFARSSGLFERHRRRPPSHFGDSRRHTFQNSDGLYHTGQLPRNVAPDFQLRCALGLLRRDRRKGRAVLQLSGIYATGGD